MTPDPLQSYSAYLDGHGLSDAEVAALRSWIAADAENAREFVELAILHAAITDRLMLGRLLDDLAAHRDIAVTPTMLADAIREIEVNSPRTLLPLRPREPEPIAGASLTDMFAAIAATLVFCVGAWALWQGGAEAPPLAAAPHQTVQVAPQVQAPQVAAKLRASFNAQWAGRGGLPLGETMFDGTTFELLSGAVQLDMADGAAVVIEGPSKFTLTGPDALELDQGKAAVRVSEEGKSFVLDTPSLKVIDLGTEFGVETATTGVGRVMVFDGVVALADSAASEDDDHAESSSRRRIEAGYEVAVDQEEVGKPAAGAIEPLSNARHFMRPDEVALRLSALAGSLTDYKLANHYQRQRIQGLLAFQGFDAPSGGVEYTIGLGTGGLLAQSTMQFVDAAEGAAGIDVQAGPVFMTLDTTSAGPFGRAGLLAPSGRIGRPGTELWLTWRTQRREADTVNEGSAGLSLMSGENSDADEPVFIGRGFGPVDALCAQSVWGGSVFPNGERLTSPLDVDGQKPDIQVQDVDNRVHTWVARLRFRAGADLVSVWLDQDLSVIGGSGPQAELEVSEIEFDRIRLAVNRGEEIWRFGDFAAATNLHALESLTQVGAFRADR